MDSDRARQLFDSKAPSIDWAMKRWFGHRLVGDAYDDLRQDALLYLWERCIEVDDPSKVSVTICIMRATSRRKYFTRRDEQRLAGRHIGSLDEPLHGNLRFTPADQLAAHEPSIEVDGIRLTMADLDLDKPGLRDMVEGGVDMATVAARLGVSRQRVQQLHDKLGAVQIGRRWVFPADAGMRKKPDGTPTSRASGTVPSEPLGPPHYGPGGPPGATNGQAYQRFA